MAVQPPYAQTTLNTHSATTTAVNPSSTSSLSPSSTSPTHQQHHSVPNRFLSRNTDAIISDHDNNGAPPPPPSPPRNHPASGYGDEDSTDMWDPMDGGGGADFSDCECGGAGAPPEFILPPPPRPPFLQNELYCSEDPLPEIETCDALPMIDASYRSSPSFDTFSVIILCSLVMVAVVIVSAIIVWKHKRKVQNFLPCKTSPANHCGPAGVGPTGGTGSELPGNGVVYEDLSDVLPRTAAHHARHHPHHHHHHIAPSIEMIDVKNSIPHYPSGYPMTPHSPPVFLCSSPGPDPYSSQDLYNPVYEELSDADDSDRIVDAPHSEDEFAEDELSLGGGDILHEDPRLAVDPSVNLRLVTELHCPPPPYSRPPTGQIRRDGRTLPPGYRRQQVPLPPVPTSENSSFRRPRSLDRRRNVSNDWRSQDRGEFHEGMLLDRLLQFYPRVGSVGPPSVRSRNVMNQDAQNGTGAHRMPYLISNNAIPPQTNDSGSISPHQTVPYDSVPVIGHLQNHYGGNTTFRPPPKPHSQDSALGSDSGYSNHTAGTRNSNGSGSNRGTGNGGTNNGSRRNGSSNVGDNRRLSQLSADLPMT